MGDSKRIGNERGEGDWASGVVHIIGGGIALIGLPFILIDAIRGGSGPFIAGIAIYCAFLLAYFVISAISHALSVPKGRMVLGALDNAASIFVVSATWVPISLVCLPGRPGWILLSVLWASGILVFLLGLFTTERIKRYGLVLFYTAFTLVLPLIPAVHRLLGDAVFPWLALAGLLDVVGLFFRDKSNMPYNHAIWHSFILAASICAYFAIVFLP